MHVFALYKYFKLLLNYYYYYYYYHIIIIIIIIIIVIIKENLLRFHSFDLTTGPCCNTNKKD